MCCPEAATETVPVARSHRVSVPPSDRATNAASMNETDHPLFARIYDPMMAIPERLFLAEHREYLVEGLSGAVLDVGAGTGVMFDYVASAAEGDGDVTFHAIEPDPHMRSQAVEEAESVGLDVDIADASAEQLPYENDTFDVVMASFVFCTIPDEEAALDEVARVLRPGGEFRFVEHVRGSGLNGHLHRALAPGWYHVAGGCHLDRQTGELFRRDERFELLDFRRFESGPASLLPVVRGRLQLRTDSLLSRLL